MIDEGTKEFRKFLHSPVGKKILASRIIEDVDPQHLLENYMLLCFKAGRSSMGPQPEEPDQDLLPVAVINLYNEIFRKELKAVPQRLEIVRGRIKEAKKVKMELTIEHFRTVFHFKKKEAENKDESWLDFETLCARKHFFKYLEQAKPKGQVVSGKTLNIVNERLF